MVPTSTGIKNKDSHSKSAPVMYKWKDDPATSTLIVLEALRSNQMPALAHLSMSKKVNLEKMHRIQPH